MFSFQLSANKRSASTYHISVGLASKNIKINTIFFLIDLIFVHDIFLMKCKVFELFLKNHSKTCFFFINQTFSISDNSKSINITWETFYLEFIPQSIHVVILNIITSTPEKG